MVPGHDRGLGGGAGDAYTSTLAAALTEGIAPGEAMLQAAINAAAVVGALDTTSGLMTQEAMTARRGELDEVALKRF